MSVNEISDAKIIIAFCILFRHLLYIIVVICQTLKTKQYETVYQKHHHGSSDLGMHYLGSLL